MKIKRHDKRYAKQVGDCSIDDSLESILYHARYLNHADTQKDYHEKLIQEHVENVREKVAQIVSLFG